MTRPEGIVTVDVSHRRQLACELGVPLLFSRLKPQILQQQHLSGPQFRPFGNRIRPDRVGGEQDGLSQQFRQSLRNRCQAVFRLGLVGRASQMTHQDRRSTSLEDRTNRRQGHFDPTVIGDLPVVIQRDIEIHADEYGLALDIDVHNRFFGHGVLISFDGCDS